MTYSLRVFGVLQPKFTPFTFLSCARSLPSTFGSEVCSQPLKFGTVYQPEEVERFPPHLLHMYPEPDTYAQILH